MNRDSSGRFIKGNTASVGNKGGRPPRAREERFYEITIKACTYSDWRKIIKRAVEQAKAGDSAARKFLADYIIGPPVQRQEITGNIQSQNTIVVREYVSDGDAGD